MLLNPFTGEPMPGYEIAEENPFTYRPGDFIGDTAEENPHIYCRGCGVPDDCMCHEDCSDYPCAWHAWQLARDIEEAHAEALEDIRNAPTLRPGEIPGDAIGMAGRHPMRAPWWWDQVESYEYRQFHGLLADNGKWSEQHAAGAL